MCTNVSDTITHSCRAYKRVFLLSFALTLPFSLSHPPAAIVVFLSLTLRASLSLSLSLAGDGGEGEREEQKSLLSSFPFSLSRASEVATDRYRERREYKRRKLTRYLLLCFCEREGELKKDRTLD